MRQVLSCAKQLLLCGKGATITEFAIVSPVLLIMIFGGLDLGHQALVRSMMQGALADTARQASMEDPGFVASGNTLQERIRNAVKETIDPIAPGATYDIEIANFYDFSGVGNPEKLLTDVDGSGTYDPGDGDCFEDLNGNGAYDLDAGRDGVGGANDVVFYKAAVLMPRLFPLAGLLGWSENAEVDARMAIRNQPYGEQGTPVVLCGVY